jgi:hypothetical protein
MLAGVRRMIPFAAALACGLAAAPAASARIAPVHPPAATPSSCAIQSALILVGPGGMSPTSVRTDSYGADLTFDNGGATTITVADTSGLGLFSHAIASGEAWQGRYPAAGLFTFGVTGVSADTGSVSAPFCDWQERTVGSGQSTDLSWAYRGVSGLAFDVEIKRPGATRWAWWRYGNTTGWSAFSSTTAGYYGFRSRVRRVATGKVSGFSPESVVHVR